MIRRTSDGFSARYGLTGIQSRIISYIACTPPGQDVFQKDIEKCFGIRRSSVTSVISNLEQNGFLQRRAVPGDARLKKLILTPAGLAIHKEITDSILKFEQSLCSVLTEKEKSQLMDMLKRIIDFLDDGAACHASDDETQKNLLGKDETLC